MGSAWVVFWEPHASGDSVHGTAWPPEGTCAACIVAAAVVPQYVLGGGSGPPQPILAAHGTEAGPRGAMGLMDPFCCTGTEGA